MSKVHKWKVEKTKIKVVFRLQFHAAHIPQTGWDKLFLSFIPAETGKATAKTNKANVRNGNCKWSDPIYEATRLLQDVRTKKYDDKFYKLIVAMGSSRASILGEADVNLAKFVDALKPATVALPLQGCDYGTILHVTVQILTTKTGFREFEQQSVKGPHMASSNGIGEPVEIAGPSSDEKINARTRLRETSSYMELPSVEEATESTEDGIDGSSHTSDSLHAEKTEIPLFPLPHSLDKIKKNDLNPNRLSTQGSNDWTHGWASDFSDNNDLTFAYEENNQLRVRLEVAESAFLQLKSEAKSLQRMTDELGAETQALAHQLALELDSGQSLVREVTSLKTECSNLKRDIRELESAKSSFQVLDKGSTSLLMLVENKVHEIRDKVCMGMCADTDFEVLVRAIGNLKQGLRIQDESDWVINQEDPLTKKEKMCELLQKLEESKTENELSVKKMNQMERYYESYIHQMEESHKETVKELGTLRDDHSSHLYTISLLQSQIEKLHEEMSGVMVQSVEEKKGLEILNKELERRAVASENTLKRVRQNYTVAVDRLQKDLELLSFQVLSIYESNETLAKQPFEHSDSNLNLNLNPNLEEVSLNKCHSNNQIQLNGELEGGKKEISRCTVIDAHREDEILAMYVAMVQLDFFSELLIGAVNGANDGVIRTKNKALELEMELRESNRSSKETEAKYVAKCDDLAVRIQILDAKLNDLTEERDKLKGLYIEESTQKGKLEAEIGALKEKIKRLNEERELVERMKLEYGVKLRDVELDLEASRTKLDFSSKVIETLQRELQDLTEKHKASLEVEEIQGGENRELMEKLKLLEVELQHVTDERKSLVQDFQESSIMREELEKMQMSLLKCEEDKRILQDELQVSLETKAALESSLMKADSEIQAVTGKLKISQDLEVVQEKENRKLLSELELKEVKFQQAADEIRDLMQRVQDSNGICEELERTKKDLSSCQEEHRTLECDLKNLQEVKITLENSLKKAESDLEASNTKLELSMKAVEKLKGELVEVRGSFCISSEAEQILVKNNAEFLSKLESLEAELELLKGKNLDLMQKSETFKEELERTKEVKKELENELLVLRETNASLESSLQKSESELKASTINLEISSRTVEKLENEVEEVRENIKISTEANSELLEKLELLEGELQQVNGKSRDLTLKLESSDIIGGELEKTKAKLFACEEEKRNLENELKIIQERSIEHETSFKRAEADLKDCTTKLDFSDKVIQNQRQEMQKVTQRFERESSELLSRLEFVEVELKQATEECTHLMYKLHDTAVVKEELERNKEILENEISNLNFNLEEADKHIRTEKEMREELEITASDLAAKLEDKEKEIILFLEEKTKLRGRIVELEKANISMQHLMLHNEENQREKETEFENRLLVVLEGLIASDAESSYMQCQLRELCSQLNTSKNEIDNVDYNQQDQILQIKEELEFLRVSKEEADILNIVLRCKLEEQHSIICKLNESRIELGGLRENQRELTRRLSEQTLKAEEYKNLSIHLRDLKDKADTEGSNQVTDKRETESLRIVFIREQYESKIQELKNQLGVSKKYAEEMLMKLQTALDEVETGKKNEIALAKRIEELSISLSEMEAEMQSLRTDRRELVSAYDNLKTELECTLLSFDCCKEEKSKLETCFHECNEERRKIKVELDLVKRLMENMASAENGNVHSGVSNGGSIEQILGGGDDLLDGNDRGLTGVNGCTPLSGSPLSSQVPENITSNAINETTKDELFEKHQKLKLGLSLFQKELEKLKKDNLSSLLPIEADEIDPSLHGLERSLSQLDMANEHLGNVFPSFKELAGSGNALERVLALELELAEALQEKKRIDTRFQSSFLKQHNDEEAIFQSFRDINELIQDMIELKKRHATVECELQEMHGRYSQLSVQFAEVEGERQKLMMSLKNRSSRKS